MILSVLILGVVNTQCSSDNNDSSATQNDTHTLWVNDTPFAIATNQVGGLFNTTQFMAGTAINGGTNVRTFTMVNQAVSISDVKTIMLTVSFPNVGASINGTYPIMQTLSNTENAALIAYQESDNTFGGGEFNATGSVTITDNGNNNFKLVFNNVVVQGATSTNTKTLTGYCQPTFAVIPSPGKN